MNETLREKIAHHIYYSVNSMESTNGYYKLADEIMKMCVDETESILGPTSRHSELQDMSEKLNDELWDNLIL